MGISLSMVEKGNTLYNSCIQGTTVPCDIALKGKQTGTLVYILL